MLEVLTHSGALEGCSVPANIPDGDTAWLRKHVSVQGRGCGSGGWRGGVLRAGAGRTKATKMGPPRDWEAWFWLARGGVAALFQKGESPAGASGTWGQGLGKVVARLWSREGCMRCRGRVGGGCIGWRTDDTDVVRAARGYRRSLVADPHVADLFVDGLAVTHALVLPVALVQTTTARLVNIRSIHSPLCNGLQHPVTIH